jgi:glycine hydroxymethyltransferase
MNTSTPLSAGRIFELTAQESERQRNTLNLIASENYPSPKTLSLLGSLWSNKYAEGYPGKRYYAGQEYTDQLETYVQQLALQVFDTTGEYGVNVQVLSGSPANAMVYLAVLEAGDTIMSLNLANGGHLSHLHETSNWNKFFKHVSYNVRLQSKADLDSLSKLQSDSQPDLNYVIDLEDFEKQLVEHKPRLVIIGFSAYPGQYTFHQMSSLAHQHGALVLADIAHINGLVAAGLHDTPFKTGEGGADFVSMTTHKTMRGPRGALLFARGELIQTINKTVFPGTSGGPHMHQIAAIGQALEEILGTQKYPDMVDFVTYSQNVLDTCQSLENGLKNAGITIVSPTQTHLCLVKLPDEVDSLLLQKRLESVGIITNRNMIPFDSKPAWRPSGLRLGTAALASRGLQPADSYQLGETIGQYILGSQTDAQMNTFVHDLLSRLNWHYTI